MGGARGAPNPAAALLNPAPSAQDQSPGPPLSPGGGSGGHEPGRALGSGALRPAAGARSRSAPWGSTRGRAAEAPDAFRRRWRAEPPSLPLGAEFQPRSSRRRLPGWPEQGRRAGPAPARGGKGIARCRWEGSPPALPLPTASPGLNAAAASARCSRLAVPTSGTPPARLPGPIAREAPPVGSALRPRLRAVRQAQVSQRAWGRRGVCGAAGVRPDQGPCLTAPVPLTVPPPDPQRPSSFLRVLSKPSAQQQGHRGEEGFPPNRLPRGTAKDVPTAFILPPALEG